MSNLLIRAPGPSEDQYSSKWKYCKEKSSCEIKSLIDEPLGAERSIIILQDPSFFGTRPIGEHCRLGRGGALNGPAMHLREISFKR